MLQPSMGSDGSGHAGMIRGRSGARRAALLSTLVGLAITGAAGCSDDQDAGPGATASATAPRPKASVSASATDGVHSRIVVVIPEASASVSGNTGVSVPTARNKEPTAAPPTDGPHVPPESIDTEDKRLSVTVGGETVFIRNGGRVELGDDVAVEIYLDPYPPTTLHSVVDLYLTRDGEPVTDASIDVEFDMLAMVHGPFVATAKKIGAGHHLATLDYIMFGAWDQFVTIRQGLERVRFPVVIVAYP